MPSSPAWLTTLQRIREHHRDSALHSLAQCLAAVAKVRDTATHVESQIADRSAAQQQVSDQRRLDPNRLRQIRQDRDDLRTQLAALRQQQSVAESAVCQAQAMATKKNTELDALRKLSSRYDSAHQQARRRQEEQSPVETAASLCNGGLSH